MLALFRWLYWEGEGRELEDIEEGDSHERNRSQWPLTVEKIFSESNRSMFKGRFGLDIWHSFARMPHSENSQYGSDYGAPQATITYLTLPDTATKCRRWQNSDPNAWNARTSTPDHIENGFGAAVEICKQPSAEELDRFSKALKFLDLKPFAHSSQKEDPVLRLGSPDTSVDFDTARDSRDPDESHVSTKAGDRDDKAAAAMLLPRLTLLTRHFE
jgi:hypothetical protein